MPILDVEIVGRAPEGEGLAQRLADAAGEAMGARPGGTWVKLVYREAALYAESGGAPVGVAPIFARVLQRDPPTGDVLARQTAELARVIGLVCARPLANVHVIHEGPGRGRVAFGGRLELADS